MGFFGASVNTKLKIGTIFDSGGESVGITKITMLYKVMELVENRKEERFHYSEERFRLGVFSLQPSVMSVLQPSVIYLASDWLLTFMREKSYLGCMETGVEPVNVCRRMPLIRRMGA